MNTNNDACVKTFVTAKISMFDVRFSMVDLRVVTQAANNENFFIRVHSCFFFTFKNVKLFLSEV